MGVIATNVCSRPLYLKGFPNNVNDDMAMIASLGIGIEYFRTNR